MANLVKRLRVSVLGPVRAWIDEHELNLGPARQRAVFAALAISANRLVSHADLIAAVWGTTPPATAAGSVYTYVSGLRRCLDPDRSGDAEKMLISGRSGYTLRLAPGELDSDRFRQLCTGATDLQAAGDLTSAAAALDKALRLWCGDAYAGLHGHHFDLERAYLTERRLAAIEQRARIMMELGYDDLVAELSGLVRDHPLHEPLHELLMLALHRAGRRREALEVFREAQRVLDAELDITPGPTLLDLHRRIVEDSVEPPPGLLPQPTVSIAPAIDTQAVRDEPVARRLLGRSAELARLQRLVHAVSAGAGSTVWIEGEPGIGKSELLTAVGAAAATQGCQLAWGTADRWESPALLRIWRTLGVEPTSDVPRHAAFTAELPTDADEADVAAYRLLAYVRSVCAVAPLVLLVDNLQSTSEVSVHLWKRLVAATRRLPLLLVFAARAETDCRELTGLRRAVQARQGHVLTLQGLAPTAIEELISTLVGAPIGPNLARIVPLAAGNPLYARELTSDLLRRSVVRISDGRADIDAFVRFEAQKFLLGIIRSTVDVLSEGTQEMLRLAAMLGTEFAIDDIVAVTGRSPLDLAANIEEVLKANIIVDTGTGLAFRHPFLRKVLYESVPASVRASLHRHTAEVLDHGGSPVPRVAKQLAAERLVIDAWVVDWLVTRHAEAVKQVPGIASELLRQVLATDLPSRSQRETLLVALVKLDFRYERHPEEKAREALAITTDPADRAEMRQLLAVMRHRRGDAAGAIDLLTDAVYDPRVPDLWRTRHWVLLSRFRRGGLDDLDRADHTAQKMYDEAIAVGRPYDAAFTLQTRWLTNSIRRDHERALDYVDRAIDAMPDRLSFAGMYLDLLDNRMFALQNLDRMEEAERTLRKAALFAIRHRLPASLQVASAVQRYWLGRWDDAVAEVSAVTDDEPVITYLGMREPSAMAMLLRGVAALIAARRDDRDLAAAHLDAANTLPATGAERENSDFLLVARALVSEMRGGEGDALEQLAPLLTPEYAPMMLRHQWLPDVLRLALEVGRDDVARRASAIILDEAAKEVRPARAWAAAARCRALTSGVPEPALEAAAHYRLAGRVPELAAALEDAAVLLAAGRRPHEAARHGAEAAEIYTALGARWDLRRTRRRLAEFGVDPVPTPPIAVNRG
ncbi:BTAD domain-containing putative transcriptional regulator [Micromonospora sp. NBC_00858]|uniref:BTAD domain-containing putative transcriptional regulator n=1 Tax=Micromonospora sp. NBC_00858 TaxID=2975979 RepID=UPI00386AE9C0|nr:AAA family ATPase [Micromonospora sp. NBC_00858]